MGKYVVATVSTKPKALKYFQSASAAQKFRTKKYKQGYKGKLWIIGKRGLISSTTYGK